MTSLHDLIRLTSRLAWHNLFCGGVQEEVAQARQARAAAAAESRKERDAGRRKALARKVPVTAIMSQQQRCRVEQVLAQLRDAQQVSSNANSAGECFYKFRCPLP